MSDLISRQAAIEALEHMLAEPAYQHTGEDWYVGVNCAESELYYLPSAQSERKVGKWIKNEDRSGWHCSCCGKDDLYAYPYMENNERELQDFYCPNCGADMRGEEDE